jgi:hypothetical protein
MPCNSDYLEPSEREKYLQDTAKLLVQLLQIRGLPVTDWILNQADSIYASDGRLVPELCSQISAIPEEVKETIMYDGHSEFSRSLASWWHRHQQEDLKRLGGSAPIDYSWRARISGS